MLGVLQRQRLGEVANNHIAINVAQDWFDYILQFHGSIPYLDVCVREGDGHTRKLAGRRFVFLDLLVCEASEKGCFSNAGVAQ
jgi:hypothetical protein